MPSFASSRSRKIQANAQADSDAPPVDLPKVEERMVAVPNGLSTDYDVFKREAESMLRRNLRANAQKFEFQAEVSWLVDIIINSLYSNKDIFLRELISNASDIKLDKEKKILSIRDRGIGMTEEDLIKCWILSKHNAEKQYVWESRADGAFAISEDEWNEPLDRGTEIRLHLRDEAQEYLD